ncbi:MAG: type IV pilus secretin PilQ [Candidatus Omnitrophica bacterium]|nr:type IV pilus secretin PilQ [Candidatus Omnitrophota bacterium]
MRRHFLGRVFNLILFVFLAGVGARPAAAADPAANAVEMPVNAVTMLPASAVVPTETAPIATTEPSIAETAASDNGLVSLDFREADVQNVLKILALKSGVNIVPSPTVTGPVTIQLKNVPWEQALDVVLSTYGFAAERKGSIILVSTIADLKKRRDDAAVLAEQEPLETKAFPLSFGKAKEVLNSIEKMKTERGSINMDDRTNTIILTDISSRIKLIEKVVQQLDTTTPQVLIEAKMIKKTFVDSDNLGIDWLTKITVGGSIRPTSFPFKDAVSDTYLQGAFPAPTGFTYGTLNASQIQAVFEVLKSQTDTQVLSNPRLVTLDNKAAKIGVTTDYPIPSYELNKDTGQLIISGFTWIEMGITFSVTPHVNSKELVTMEVTPEVSSSGGETVFSGNTMPLIAKEKVTTNVMVRNGETLVIGGLIKNTVTKYKKEIPWFGRIPLLGWLFKKTNNSGDKTDLLIFVTPHIITMDAASSGAGDPKPAGTAAAGSTQQKT